MISQDDINKFKEEYDKMMKGIRADTDFIIYPTKPDENNCECDISVLMNRGCQCKGG